MNQTFSCTHKLSGRHYEAFLREGWADVKSVRVVVVYIGSSEVTYTPGAFLKTYETREDVYRTLGRAA